MTYKRANKIIDDLIDLDYLADYELDAINFLKNRVKELESENKKLNAENQQLFERLIELEGEKK